VKVDDFVSPPQMCLRRKRKAKSRGRWASTWLVRNYGRHFGVPGSAPAASGVFANQPSPLAGKVRTSWRTFLVLIIALLAIRNAVQLVFRKPQRVSTGTTPSILARGPRRRL